MNKISTFCLSLFITTTAMSQTWEGDTSSDWNDPLNWSGNTLPADADNIIINPSNYTNPPIMSSNSNFEPGDLTVTNGGTFTITGGAIIIRDDVFVDNATFTISGGTMNVDEITGDNNASVNLIGGIVSMTNDLDANSGSTFTIATTVTQTTANEDLNIGTNATFVIQEGANISGFDDVDFDSDGGTLTMTGGTLGINDDFKFQDGDDNTVNISGGTLNLGDDFEIETDNNQITFSGDADINVGGQFEFGANGGGTDNDSTNSNVNVEGNATLDVVGNINFYEGGSGSNSFLNVSGNGSVAASNVDDLGSVNISEGGTVNNGGTVLPVELLFFKGILDKNSVTLSWETASELNNDYFEILRSKNGEDFSPIGRVIGSGSTSILSKYTFLDRNASGINYYQLRQVDYNGSSEEFNIIRIESEIPTSLTVFPNPIPANEAFTISINDPGSEKTIIKVIGIDGKEVFAREIGDPQKLIKISDAQLDRGNYILLIQSNTNIITRNIVIK